MDDLETDPWELKNLAGNTKFTVQLKKMRDTLDSWIKQSGDQGQKVEPMTMYDSDMEVYLKQIRPRRPERVKLIEANIRLMKQWWAEEK